MFKHYNAIIALPNDHLNYKEGILHGREEIRNFTSSGMKNSSRVNTASEIFSNTEKAILYLQAAM